MRTTSTTILSVWVPEWAVCFQTLGSRTVAIKKAAGLCSSSLSTELFSTPYH